MIRAGQTQYRGREQPRFPFGQVALCHGEPVEKLFLRRRHTKALHLVHEPAGIFQNLEGLDPESSLKNQPQLVNIKSEKRCISRSGVAPNLLAIVQLLTRMA